MEQQKATHPELAVPLILVTLVLFAPPPTKLPDRYPSTVRCCVGFGWDVH